MKDKVKKILVFIGFMLIAVGAIISGLGSTISLTSLGYLGGVFVICFINSNNKTLVNFGYAIAGIGIADGVVAITMKNAKIADILGGAGMILMGVAALLYAIGIVCRFFGVTRTKKGYKNNEMSTIEEIETYAEMKKDGILTEEEFVEMKNKVFKVEETTKSNIEDLKKWKKLFDQKVITEEEFSSVKAEVLKK